MDIRCPYCGEPWDLDCLHDATEERVGGKYTEKDYKETQRLFMKQGCAAVGGKCSPTKADPRIKAAFDLLGEDFDGVASALEDEDID